MTGVAGLAERADAVAAKSPGGALAAVSDAGAGGLIGLADAIAAARLTMSAILRAVLTGFSITLSIGAGRRVGGLTIERAAHSVFVAVADSVATDRSGASAVGRAVLLGLIALTYAVSATVGRAQTDATIGFTGFAGFRRVAHSVAAARARATAGGAILAIITSAALTGLTGRAALAAILLAGFAIFGAIADIIATDDGRKSAIIGTILRVLIGLADPIAASIRALAAVINAV